ncbi:MAG TPA: hypothetical protein VLL52_11580 [Anaerolineae bacterium]|nr:hypothetical protein [Anaerolineae bacterium]
MFEQSGDEAFPLSLKYYMLDWDDNILYMPTKIYLEKDGERVDVSTKDFAEIRRDPSYKPLGGSWEKAFAGFDDNTGDFVGDTRRAIAAGAFAPSYEAFKTALLEARLFCIVTARGHSAETLRQGVEVIIHEVFTEGERAEMLKNIQKFNRLAGFDIADEEALDKYLALNGYVGVSSPGFLKVFENYAPEGIETGSSPENAKTFAVRRFVEHTLELIDTLSVVPRDISFGFSDDDERNVVTMREFLDAELVDAHTHIDFFVYHSLEGALKGERLG